MTYVIEFDDVSVSTVTKKKKIETDVFTTEDVNEFVDMCATIDTQLKGRDGLIKVTRPIVKDGVLVGISYRYQERN